MYTIKDRIELLTILPRDLVIAELGVFVGDYSKQILEYANPSILYLVDIFDQHEGNCMGVHVNNMAEYEKILTDRYKDNNNVFVLKMTSKDFLLSVEKNHLDCVYIDADHSYEAVKQDLELSYQCIKKGGWICGHDYNHSTVMQALDEFLKKYQLEINYLTNKKYGEQSFVIKL